MRYPYPGGWILRRFVSQDSVGRSIMGDLAEEYEVRREREGRTRAWLWYNRQAFSVALHRIGSLSSDGRAAMGRGGSMQDMTFAWRALRAHPGVHGLVVGVIAVGVAGTALAFSLVDQALLRALPFEEPQELYAFRHLSEEVGADIGNLSPLDLGDLRSQLGWNETMASYSFDPATSVLTLTGEGIPEAVKRANVDGPFFEVLGVGAFRGRTLQETDQVRGRDDVAVLSHSYWLNRFSAAPNMVGRTLRLDGDVVEVVGIMPPSFQFPSPDVDIWMPVSRVTEDMIPNLRQVRWRKALLRVPAESSPSEARVAAEGVFSRLEASYPDTNQGWSRAEIVPLRDILVGGFKNGVFFLMGITGLLMLVVCASVGGLLTARTARRGRELAIRRSVGADRMRLTRQILGESLILAGLGGSAGLVLAWMVAPVVSQFSSEVLGFSATVSPDLRMAGFTGMVSLLAGLVFGIIPAWSVLTAPPSAFLGGARSGVSGLRRGFRTLVLAETILAAVLLAGTGLMVRSFWSLVDTDPGFQSEDVWSLRLSVNARGDFETLLTDRQAILDLAAAVPGVISAGGSKTPLLEGGGEPWEFSTVGGGGEDLSVSPESGTYIVLPGFFETLGARFSAGRPFREDDNGLGIVVNETLAEGLWSGRNPLDQQLMLGGMVLSVVGVVEPLHDNGLTAGSPAAVYVDARHAARVSLYLFVRIEPGAEAAIPAIREAIWAQFPDQAILETSRITSLLDQAVARPRWLSRVIGSFGILALILAALGIYGVVSQAVQNQRGEIAVRIALGAGPNRVLREQLSGGVWIILVGTALGLGLAAALGRAMSSLLFGITPTDLPAFLAAAGTVILFGFLASLLPAHRATRVDPVRILREE